MGRAVLEGLLASDVAEGWQVEATTRSASSQRRLAATLPEGVSLGLDNAEACARADVVVLAVKPHQARSVLSAPGVAEALRDTALISLCAGVTTATLADLVPEARILRAMPNTPAVIQQGMTVVASGPGATEADLALAEEIFGAVGRVRELDESHFDAATGLSGSGPAFAFVILEALSDGGVMMGLPRDVATELAAQTLQGAARLVLETDQHPAALRDLVTTPAGCTIAGLFRLEEGRVRSTLARTVQDAAITAKELGRSPDDDAR